MCTRFRREQSRLKQCHQKKPSWGLSSHQYHLPCITFLTHDRIPSEPGSYNYLYSAYLDHMLINWIPSFLSMPYSLDQLRIYAEYIVLYSASQSLACIKSLGNQIVGLQPQRCLFHRSALGPGISQIILMPLAKEPFFENHCFLPTLECWGWSQWTGK